ncbi:hypothetical protein GCM10010174_49420 [Kutzneria viridogrisea]|uniref:Uncharacterized protein n=2 Tax=Kutzneria TaxID=43356 RepID=W5WF34_9PSEU|nr:hypothetical protein [Kutzneria albida]AHH99181.1 hypothetical protein KALB_5820 [Kutzneria albida DSM 43870]MBA8923265.1 hypothetical protein [Kutzneria viridogrisea]
MMSEKSLLRQALGEDEPPMTVDLEAVEAQGRRALRRRRQIIPLATTMAAVALVAGGVVVVNGHDTSPAQVTPASPGTSTTVPKPVISTAAPSQKTMAYCYRTADITIPTDATNQHVAVGINGHIDGRGEVTGHIMNICRQAWEKNYYDWFPASSGQQQRSAPALVACVLNSHAVDAEEGSVGVFPGDEQTCANLGMAVAKI